MTSPPRRLILDANILLRAALGPRVRHLLRDYRDANAFYTPDYCFEEAIRSVDTISRARNSDPTLGLLVLDELALVIATVDRSLYELHEQTARRRIASRDIKDWPILATALLLNCPIWTEDRDFFGSSIATWTTANVELYLNDQQK